MSGEHFYAHFFSCTYWKGVVFSAFFSLALTVCRFLCQKENAPFCAVPSENKVAKFYLQNGICRVIGLCIPPRSAAALCLASAALQRFCDASQFLQNLCFLMSLALSAARNFFRRHGAYLYPVLYRKALPLCRRALIPAAVFLPCGAGVPPSVLSGVPTFPAFPAGLPPDSGQNSNANHPAGTV